LTMPVPFEYDHVVRILATVKEILKNESHVVECATPVCVLGDLHGSTTNDGVAWTENGRYPMITITSTSGKNKKNNFGMMQVNSDGMPVPLIWGRKKENNEEKKPEEPQTNKGDFIIELGDV
ncbi:hypothetical protein PENTCL1PPCAC_8009, partial [Pristionchus entomophagus]